MENVQWFLKKLKMELPYNPAIPLPGMYPNKTIIQKDACTHMFIAALLTIAKTWKQCPSTDEWIKKRCLYIYIYVCVYTHTHIYIHNRIIT